MNEEQEDARIRTMKMKKEVKTEGSTNAQTLLWCCFCDDRFRTPALLSMHLDRYNVNWRLFWQLYYASRSRHMCVICDILHADKKSLECHYKMVHCISGQPCADREGSPGVDDKSRHNESPGTSQEPCKPSMGASSSVVLAKEPGVDKPVSVVDLESVDVVFKLSEPESLTSAPSCHEMPSRQNHPASMTVETETAENSDDEVQILYGSEREWISPQQSHTPVNANIQETCDTGADTDSPSSTCQATPMNILCSDDEVEEIDSKNLAMMADSATSCRNTTVGENISILHTTHDDNHSSHDAKVAPDMANFLPNVCPISDVGSDRPTAVVNPYGLSKGVGCLPSPSDVIHVPHKEEQKRALDDNLSDASETGRSPARQHDQDFHPHALSISDDECDPLLVCDDSDDAAIPPSQEAADSERSNGSWSSSGNFVLDPDCKPDLGRLTPSKIAALMNRDVLPMVILPGMTRSLDSSLPPASRASIVHDAHDGMQRHSAASSRASRTDEHGDTCLDRHRSLVMSEVFCEAKHWSDGGHSYLEDDDDDTLPHSLNIASVETLMAESPAKFGRQTAPKRRTEPIGEFSGSLVQDEFGLRNRAPKAVQSPCKNARKPGGKIEVFKQPIRECVGVINSGSLVEVSVRDGPLLSEGRDSLDAIVMKVVKRSNSVIRCYIHFPNMDARHDRWVNMKDIIQVYRTSADSPIAMPATVTVPPAPLPKRRLAFDPSPDMVKRRRKSSDHSALVTQPTKPAERRGPGRPRKTPGARKTGSVPRTRHIPPSQLTASLPAAAETSTGVQARLPSREAPVSDHPSMLTGRKCHQGEVTKPTKIVATAAKPLRGRKPGLSRNVKAASTAVVSGAETVVGNPPKNVSDLATLAKKCGVGDVPMPPVDVRSTSTTCTISTDQSRANGDISMKRIANFVVKDAQANAPVAKRRPGRPRKIVVSEKVPPQHGQQSARVSEGPSTTVSTVFSEDSRAPLPECPIITLSEPPTIPASNCTEESSNIANSEVSTSNLRQGPRVTPSAGLLAPSPSKPAIIPSSEPSIVPSPEPDAALHPGHGMTKRNSVSSNNRSNDAGASATCRRRNLKIQWPPKGLICTPATEAVLQNLHCGDLVFVASNVEANGWRWLYAAEMTHVRDVLGLVRYRVKYLGPNRRSNTWISAKAIEFVIQICTGSSDIRTTLEKRAWYVPPRTMSRYVPKKRPALRNVAPTSTAPSAKTRRSTALKRAQAPPTRAPQRKSVGGHGPGEVGWRVNPPMAPRASRLEKTAEKLRIEKSAQSAKPLKSVPVGDAAPEPPLATAVESLPHQSRMETDPEHRHPTRRPGPCQTGPAPVVWRTYRLGRQGVRRHSHRRAAAPSGRSVLGVSYLALPNRPPVNAPPEVGQHAAKTRLRLGAELASKESGRPVRRRGRPPRAAAGATSQSTASSAIESQATAVAESSEPRLESGSGARGRKGRTAPDPAPSTAGSVSTDGGQRDPASADQRVANIVTVPPSAAALKRLQPGNVVYVVHKRAYNGTQVIYPAKVMVINNDLHYTRYEVHYFGWATRYNEWIAEEIIHSIVDLSQLKTFAGHLKMRTIHPELAIDEQSSMYRSLRRCSVDLSVNNICFFSGLRANGSHVDDPRIRLLVLRAAAMNRARHIPR